MDVWQTIKVVDKLGSVKLYKQLPSVISFFPNLDKNTFWETIVFLFKAFAKIILQKRKRKTLQVNKLFCD